MRVAGHVQVGQGGFQVRVRLELDPRWHPLGDTHVGARRGNRFAKFLPAKAVPGKHLHQCGRDPVRPGRADREDLTVRAAGHRGRHVGRKPGARGQDVQPETVEFGLAEAVVEHQPGAGNRCARGVSAGRRDGAGEAVAVDRRDVCRRRGGRQAGQTLASHLLQQPVAVLLQIRREVMDLGAVGEHLALHLDHVDPAGVAAPDQLTEHDGEHWPTDGRRRVRREVPVADGHTQGRAADCGVCREVGFRDQPSSGPRVGGEGAANLAGIYLSGAALGDLVQARGEVMVNDVIAGFEWGTVRTSQRPARLGVPGKE